MGRERGKLGKEEREKGRKKERDSLSLWWYIASKCRQQARSLSPAKSRQTGRTFQKQCCSSWLSYFHQKYSSLQKRLGHFDNILVTSVAFLLYAWHVKFKECLQFKQNVVEMLPSFVKLVFCCRKRINQHFWGGLICCCFDLTHLPWVPRLHGCGRNARNVAK